jgi:ribonuclease HI
MNSSKKETYYVVKRGRQTGIFKTWDECKNSVNGFQNPVYRKFDSFSEASAFLNNTKIDNKIDERQTKPDNQTQNTGATDNDYTLMEAENQQLNKVKEMAKNIKSNVFSQDLNYNFEKWNVINDEIYIFTDGSSRRSKEYFNSGIGVYLGYQCTNIKEQYHDKTNNMCELLAVDYAFKLIIKYHREIIELGKAIKIVSDSEYTIKACSIWLAQWKKNNWKTKSGEDVKNRDLIESIDGSMTRIKLINSKITNDANKIKVKFIHVNSHQKPDMTDKFKYSIWFGNYVADALSQNLI